MDLFVLYQSLGEDTALSRKCRVLLKQTHWFSVNCEFDPKTGEALPQAISAFLAKVGQADDAAVLHDRLWRITEHVRPSLKRLFRALNQSPRREHAMLPVRAVRELDANSFIKLSKRPGRNIREKLAGKPYLQGVRRYQSVDLPENRLLKAFLIRLVELLEIRSKLPSEPEDNLIPRIHSWLRTDEARAIRGWENLPPNNTLLAHRDYRSVWDSWRRLQTLDDDIDQDMSRLEERQETVIRWMKYAQMYHEGTHLFAEMPVLFDYETFSITTCFAQPLVKETARKRNWLHSPTTFTDPACVDLTNLRPSFAVTGSKPQAMPATFLWQQWKTRSATVDITLFESDAACLHSDAITIASPDLLFVADKNPVELDRAAHAFAARLRETFRNDKLIWLVPDAINDFELPIIRRNLNARWPAAEPLPRSVAAIFEQVDYTRISKEGFTVLVLETFNGKTSATKLVARFKPELKERLPATKGYYWERCPPVIISEGEATDEALDDMVTVDKDGNWHKRTASQKPNFIEASRLKADSRIGNFAFCITLSKSPVAGGMRLHAMQASAGDVPLWRDQIPELSIKANINGFYRRFFLVSHGTTIKPIRDLSVKIPIKECFTLPAGSRYYEFPLYLGKNNTRLRSSVRLDSPKFPLESEAKCQLILTFRYGDDEPYALVFAPLDKSFPPARATWKPTVEEAVTDAPAPDYPTPMSWKDLRHFPDSKNGGKIDLLRKLSETNDNLAKWMNRNDERAKENIRKSIRGWCRFLLITLWRDGRSAAAPEAPEQIRIHAERFQSLLSRISSNESKTIFDVRFLEACMHRDAPGTCIEWLTEEVQSGTIRNPRAVGFALGDVSQEWQRKIFDRLASHPSKNAISVFAYAIWREQHLIERFSASKLKTLLNLVSHRMKNIRGKKFPRHDEKMKWGPMKWARETAEPLELLLGLLRTRASDDPEIKMLLQPHQKNTKQLAEQVDRIEEIVAESNITLFSRVQIDVQKPEGIRTPDLIYALRIYLTGDDGSKAIHITGISDTDDG